MPNKDPLRQKGSPFFSELPPEIRTVVYQQIWIDAGTKQHIFYPWGEDYHPHHYPCVMKPEDFLITDVSDMEQDGANVDQEADNHHNSSQKPDICSPHWCGHEPCFESGVVQSKNRSHGEERRPRASLLSPLLVCKLMYEEASVSLYSTMEFLFSNYEHFSVLPSQLAEHVRSVHLTDYIEERQRLGPATIVYTRVDKFCREIKRLFPRLQELELILHPDIYWWDVEQSWRHMPPDHACAFALEELCKLTRDLDLQKYEVKIVVWDEWIEGREAEAPAFLAGAPFHAIMVAGGWHLREHECTQYKPDAPIPSYLQGPPQQISFD